MPPPFILFGRDHLCALGVVAVVAVALVWLVRRGPNAAIRVRRSLAVLLLLLMGVSLVVMRHQGESWRTLAPLQLCDAALFMSAWALFTLNPLACELAYCWGASGTVLAVLTPDLSVGFPAPEYFFYFALHGAVIASAVLLVLGLGRPPRKRAVWRVWLLTNAYAAAVALVDVLWGTNFLYLRAKPAHPSPLDAFGPWPWYLLVGEAVALLAFGALCLPFRVGKTAQPASAGARPGSD